MPHGLHAGPRPDLGGRPRRGAGGRRIHLPGLCPADGGPEGRQHGRGVHLRSSVLHRDRRARSITRTRLRCSPSPQPLLRDTHELALSAISGAACVKLLDRAFLMCGSGSVNFMHMPSVHEYDRGPHVQG